MMASSPYEILGIARNASDEEVKKAYREMSRKYHPDAYVDNPLADLAEEKFKQVQEAYEEIIKEVLENYLSEDLANRITLDLCIELEEADG